MKRLSCMSLNWIILIMPFRGWPIVRAADLAYKCLQETSKRITPELEEALKAVANQVQDLRFEDLERYLKEGEWKKADTTKLIA